MPTEHVSWLGSALAALGISVGGAGVRAAVKQRELESRLDGVEDRTRAEREAFAACQKTCLGTSVAIAALTGRMEGVEHGLAQVGTDVREIHGRINELIRSRRERDGGSD